MIIRICAEEDCTGCGACVNTCPKEAVRLIPDELGRAVATIDQQKCVLCGLCQKVCPNNCVPKLYAPKECYAVQATDRRILNVCASGGAGSVFGLYIVNQGGVYVGVKGFPCSQRICENAEEVLESAGSKYIESATGTVYQEVKKILNKKIYVVYIGTPCQVAGLKGYLGREYENLICIDLVCHGVPPHAYLSEYVKEKVGKEVTKISMRRGYAFRLQISKQDECCYNYDATKDTYYTLFMKGMIFRENCYHCRYARTKRAGDITIGDFWGLNKKTLKNDYDGAISCVLINNDKGKAFFDACKGEFLAESRDIQEAIQGNTQLRVPSEKPAERTEYEKNYKKHGFVWAANHTTFGKVISHNLWRAQMRRFIKKILQ